MNRISELKQRQYAHQKPVPVKVVRKGSIEFVIVRHGIQDCNSKGQPKSCPYACINMKEYGVYPFDLKLATWYKTIEDATRGVILCHGATNTDPRRNSKRDGYRQDGRAA